MVNAWVEHVRRWSKANGVSYMCAISKPECKAAYTGGKEKKLFKEINMERLRRAKRAAESKPKVRMGKTIRVPKSKLGNGMVGIDSSMIKE